MADSRAPLDRPTIVATAMALADREGVEAITMRKLAERLDYKVMSLYNHVANKEELLTEMVDTVAEEIEAPRPDCPPMTAVRGLALSFRAALLAHPWAPPLWNRHMPGPARARQMEHLLRTLAESGLSPEIAHHGFHAVINHVLGYTLQEQLMAVDHRYQLDPEGLAREFIASLDGDEFAHTIAHVHQHLDGATESSFEIVLDLILDGLVGLDATA